MKSKIKGSIEEIEALEITVTRKLYVKKQD